MKRVQGQYFEMEHHGPPTPQGSIHPAQQPLQQQKALRFVTNYGAPHPKR
jgi:hypothetical protein